jgi:predicted DNA-binding transcriptional regulator YafY
MLKYLHAGGKTRSQIAEDFGVSERTVSDDIATLQDGFNFLGTDMKINKLERGSNEYKSIIHPIFLAMNSAEIYSLTVGLKLLSRDTVFEDSLNRIANAVYEQLSLTSKDMIDEHVDDTLYFQDDSMQFIDSRNLGQMNNRPFTYFLKEPLLYKVFYIKDGENLEAQGILRLKDPSKGSLYDRLIL